MKHSNLFSHFLIHAAHVHDSGSPGRKHIVSNNIRFQSAAADWNREEYWHRFDLIWEIIETVWHNVQADYNVR